MPVGRASANLPQCYNRPVGTVLTQGDVNMSFEPFGIDGAFYIHLQLRAEAWMLVVIYALLLAAVLWRSRHDFRQLSREGWVLLGVFMPAAAVLSQMFLLGGQSFVALTPQGMPEVLHGPAVPLLGGVLILLSGAWMGVGPATLVGFASGLARAGWGTYRLSEAFEVALVAALAAYLLRQRYQSQLMAALRRPYLAGPASALLVWPLSAAGLLLQHAEPSLAAVDYVWAFMAPALPASLAEMFIGGVLVALAYRLWPAGRPNTDFPLRSAPWQTSLGRRMLFIFIPVTVAAVAVIVGAVTVTSYNTAVELVAAQMARDAGHAASTLPTFVQTGSALIRDLADKLRPSEVDIGAALREGTRAVAFFSQLLYYEAPSDSAELGDAVFRHPAEPDGLPPVTLEEHTLVAHTLASEMPQEAAIFPLNPPQLVVGFVVPVRDEGGVAKGALLGRALLDANPIMQPVIDNLRNVGGGRGKGFVVDKNNMIILHPSEPDRVTQSFSAGEQIASVVTGEDGAVFRRQDPDGSIQLVYMRAAPGTDLWSVVVAIPNVLVLERTAQVAAPLVVLLAALSVAALWGIYALVTARITRPIAQLAGAADRISGGDLALPVVRTGQDEIGRLSASLEGVRVNLRRRLEEQALLLQVSQALSAGLSLDSTVPPILKGCQQVTDAAGVRIVLAGGEDEPPAAFAAGPVADAMAVLDLRLLEMVRDERLVLERLARAKAVVDASVMQQPLGALVALPLRQKTTHLGVLWLGYTHAHSFSEEELAFLETLASQATAAIARAQLFEAVRSGREQLEIILTSTIDAVLVADRHCRLVMVNPAAESALQRDRESLLGQPVAQALADMPLLVSLFDRQSSGAETVELVGQNGRIYEAKAAALLTSSGASAGRVVMLHDITHFKELDEIKNEFVQTVSHDLRTPLTYMRGYATMLKMVGPLNEKQDRFAERIIVGIEQMSTLIDNILDIGRIESGGDMERNPCDLGELVRNVVAAHRTSALTKAITLTSDIEPGLPSVVADEHMLRQAVTNLVDNAMKYTQRGGHVNVTARRDSGCVVVAVSDNGPGISQTDQAHLFEKFYRVRKRENIAVKGSGLGLAIVRGVARRHGGDAWVESKLGKGSTFYLSVALEEAREAL